MGNTMVRLKKRQPQITVDAEPDIEDSTISITNCSVSTSSTERSTILSQCSETVSETGLLTWDRLQSIYFEIIKEASESIELQPQVILVLNDLFSAITNNILQMSQNFKYCLLETDNSHQIYFEECANKNLTSHTKNLNSEDKIRNHIFSTIFLHMKILHHMSDGNYAEVHKILKLIGISHALMKVVPNYFKVMDIAMGKFLIGNKLLTESNAEYTVIYFNYVTTYIINYMTLQQSHDNPSTGEITDNQHSTIVRENYRIMKKWHQLVKTIQEEVKQIKEPEPIPETSSSVSTVPTEILMQDACLLKYFVKRKSN